MAKLIYANCGDHYCNYGRKKKLDPYLCLYLGCGLMVGENMDVCKGLANGSKGIFKGIHLKEGQNIHVTCLNGFFVRSVYANQVENIKCEHIESKYIGRFCVEPTKVKCIVDMPNPLLGAGKGGIKPSVCITQVLMRRNIAKTDHKLQGTKQRRILLLLAIIITQRLGFMLYFQGSNQGTVYKQT
jgi:hypothetical protein